MQSQFPDLRVRDLRSAVDILLLEEHEGHGHACEYCDGHQEAATDPHLWLDPVRLAQLSQYIAGELGAAMPSGTDLYRKAADDLSLSLQSIHATLTEQLEPYRGRGFYIYHPALGYFADRYGLKQITISGGSQGPSVKALHRLISQAREAGVKTVFIQPQESRKHAEIVARAIGARLVEIDPMATDLESNLLLIGELLAKSFQDD